MNTKPKILYVDDEQTNLLLFKLSIKKDYKVYIAENGSKALKILDANPDITIEFSYVSMPVMNGLEFIEKAKTKYPDKKFVLITAYDITKEIGYAIGKGFIHGLLKKPFNINETMAVIKDAVK